MSFIDLSHDFADGMPGFSLRREGEVRQFTASIRPFVTHRDSAPFYDGQASFEITEISFQTSIGTYLDSPRHRWPDRRDIAGLTLDEVILPGLCVTVADARPDERIGLSRLDLPEDLAGKAVLIRFGWDIHWATPVYDHYPFIDADVIAALRDRGAKLLGVDTPNADSRSELSRPAHTVLLGQDILIVENLCDLGRLPATGFRFFCVPIKAVGAAAMTIRAFAETA
ncbi:MAG: cyclase family protein [Bosea sp. (in: a-proteobacteria)]|uniref:cyclase family protein n=1 Tax=Bosea sp. (in: a-proteobacteria) TaxID=1871050 RepID=UPI00273522CE|nr:cyclase family protein [Bosea sp. (in: a-proteobacteria)]MDP3603930.1 cyclase family protein [Bosea sp. (in: a-proteobacteria)]